MPGTLYLVATPIGNLDDMPPRVAATFGAADFIAAEDTRVTLRLLNHLGLKKPMVSYYEHALHHGEAILQRIEAGENCALCSDAGMPCISDPGEQIVKEAHARGIKVVPVLTRPGWPRKPPPHWKKRWLQPALCRQAVCRPQLQPNRRRRGRHSAKGRSTKS